MDLHLARFTVRWTSSIEGLRHSALRLARHAVRMHAPHSAEQHQPASGTLYCRVCTLLAVRRGVGVGNSNSNSNSNSNLGDVHGNP